jgi:hypothetical protein
MPSCLKFQDCVGLCLKMFAAASMSNPVSVLAVSNKTKFHVLVCKTKISIMLFESHFKSSLKHFFLVL